MFTETISKNKNTGQDIKEALKNIKSDEVFRYYEENTPVGRTTKAKWMTVNNVEGYFPNCRWKLSLVSSKLLYTVIKRNFLPCHILPKTKFYFLFGFTIPKPCIPRILQKLFYTILCSFPSPLLRVIFLQPRTETLTYIQISGALIDLFAIFFITNLDFFINFKKITLKKKNRTFI